MSPRRTNQYSYTPKDGECNVVRTCVVKHLFHCDNDVTLQPCGVVFSHVRPSLVWVAWPVWAEEEHLALSVVGLVVFVCKTLLRMYMLTSSDIAARQLK